MNELSSEKDVRSKGDMFSFGISTTIHGSWLFSHVSSALFSLFWGNTSGVLGLLVALRSGITPGHIQGTIWDVVGWLEPE